MSRGLIASEVENFIIENIQSVFQLEVLLLLYKNSEREWSPAQVDYELKNGLDTALAQLEDLRSRGLISVSSASESLYRYQPATPLLERAVNGLSKAYADRRVTVLGLIFSKPVSNIQLFPEASTVIKKDE